MVKGLVKYLPWLCLVAIGGCWVVDQVDRMRDERAADVAPQVLEPAKKAKKWKKKKSKVAAGVVQALDPEAKDRKRIAKLIAPEEVKQGHDVFGPEDKRELLRHDEVDALPDGGTVTTILNTETGEVTNVVNAHPEKFFKFQRSGGLGASYAMTPLEPEWSGYVWAEPLRMDKLRSTLRFELGYGTELKQYAKVALDVDLFRR